MKRTIGKRVALALIALTLVLSLSVTALAEGTGQDPQTPPASEQQPGQDPSTQQPGSQAGTGNLPGMSGKQHSGRGGQFPGGGRMNGKGPKGRTEISGLEDAIAKIGDENVKAKLNGLFEAWKTALENSRTSGAADDSALTAAEEALNAALKEAGIDYQVGRPDDGQNGFRRGQDPFAEIEAEITKLEDGDMKTKLTALLDELKEALEAVLKSAEGAGTDPVPEEPAADAIPGQVPETPGSEAAAGTDPDIAGTSPSNLLDLFRAWLSQNAD